MRKVLVCLLILVTPLAGASSLFEDDSILEIALSGPLSTLIEEKRDPREYPFTLTVGGVSRDVAVRVRGKSRVVVCPFPPLRLDFDDAEPSGTVFAEEGELKLVTHCRNDNSDSQASILNEFTAYRIFNLISNVSYRVRLMRIRYEDSDGKQKKLDAPHYGYLIESDKGLADRLDAKVVKLEAVSFGDLDMQQTARLNIFHYLIGNKDWSFVTADLDDICCHNIDLLEIDGNLLPVPYDFDLAALTRANYSSRVRLEKPTRREYNGYCRTTPESIDAAIDEVHLLNNQIMMAVADIPVLNEKTQARRETFAADFFEEAADKESLLAKIQKDCVR